MGTIFLFLKYGLSQFAKHPWVLFFSSKSLCGVSCFFLFAIRHSCSRTCWEMSSHIWSFQGECRERNLERRCSTGTLIWQAGKHTPPPPRHCPGGACEGSVPAITTTVTVWIRRCRQGPVVWGREGGNATSTVSAWVPVSSHSSLLPWGPPLGSLDPTKMT